MPVDLQLFPRPRRRTVVLVPGETLALRRCRGIEIEALRGRLWLTISGELGDIFLAAGESCRVTGNGLAVAEALGAEEACVRLSFSGAPDSDRWQRQVGWREMLESFALKVLRWRRGPVRLFR